MNLPKIKVYRRGTVARVEVDGQPFPWPISEEGILVTIDRHEPPAITLTIIANSVEVLDSIEPVRMDEPPV